MVKRKMVAAEERAKEKRKILLISGMSLDGGVPGERRALGDMAQETATAESGE
jgi:hypothetical protein